MIEPGMLIFAGAITGTVLSTGLSVWSMSGAKRARREHEDLRARMPAAARYADLHPRLEEAERRFEAQLQALSQAQSTIADATIAREQLTAAQAELVKLAADRQQQETIRADVAARRAELTALEEKLSEVRAAASEVEEQLRERDRLAAQLVDLREKTQEASRAEVIAQARLAQISAALTTRDGELATREQDIARARQDRLELQNLVDGLRADAHEATQERSIAVADRDRIAREIELATKTRDTLAVETHSLQQKLDGWKTAMAMRTRELQQVEGDKLAAEKRLENVVVQIDSSYQRLQASVARQGEAEAQVRGLETERRILAEALESDLEKAAQERLTAAQDAERIRREAQDAKHKRDDCLAEIERAQQALNKFKTAKADREKELEDLAADIDRMEKAEVATGQRLQIARGKVEEAEEKLRTSLGRQAEAEAKVKQLRAEEKIVADSVATLRAAQERLLEQLKRTGPNREHAESELWQPVLSRRQIARKVRSEDEALQDVRLHLDALRLSFPERTLLAFHTSLKVAEQSPLVVLAGISGTGKSELPRRYAEAMGMNFLLMAVQPRWDSPQDLFGFYNYLEQRYRPTELTRALIQLDGIRDAADRGWIPPKDWVKQNSISDQMLLVLFDEMNLARVEYYFSDLLSKLETRRGLDRDDATARSKAEVVLEVGPRDDTSSSMRLFTDTNVLFVGTMNEDESTQTLSDKVVDRANVLRFGRPGRLRQRDLASSAIRVKETPALSRAQFDAWVHADGDLGPLGSKLDETVSRLNVAMDRVGRPFAHRTHQAIRAYVTHYPVKGEEGFRAALGDQLEQRILPKLRGLDLTEHAHGEAFDAVRQIALEIEDAPLVASMDTARSQQQHQFNWQGVDRSEGDDEPLRTGRG